eukprot:scaffold172956_cov40-Prasinocladus_malaysianus.AAC.3
MTIPSQTRPKTDSHHCLTENFGGMKRRLRLTYHREMQMGQIDAHLPGEQMSMFPRIVQCHSERQVSDPLEEFAPAMQGANSADVNSTDDATCTVTLSTVIMAAGIIIFGPLQTYIFESCGV